MVERRAAKCYGATDERGLAAVHKIIHINDLHTMMAYLPALDHTTRSHQYSGRQIRPADLAGQVAKDVVA
ncbi:MAG TPA: DUF1501 domain-containing protein [Pirellulales bacterium]|nr:DUF1501 domain-containing protein [Pirellulales bacterium]